MDHIEWFLGLIVYLLALIIYEFGAGNEIIVAVPVLLIIYVMPIYLISRHIFDHISNWK